VSTTSVGACARTSSCVKWTAGASHGDFCGGHLQFQFIIENIGRRNSVVDNYAVEILELKRTCANLQPVVGRHTLQGRHCQYGLGHDTSLGKTGVIRIDAESAIEHGTLMFSIPFLTLEQFVAAGLQMHGPDCGIITLGAERREYWKSKYNPQCQAKPSRPQT